MQVDPIFSKYKDAVLYGVTLAVLLLIMRILEIRYLVFTHGFEVYVVVLAVTFMVLGIWVATQLMKPRTVVVETPGPNNVDIDPEACRTLGITSREIEVITLMAAGRSNGEIADALFVSVNTVKSHAARIYEKLEVKRRTQAVEKARRLRLIP